MKEPMIDSELEDLRSQCWLYEQQLVKDVVSFVTALEIKFGKNWYRDFNITSVNYECVVQQEICKEYLLFLETCQRTGIETTWQEMLAVANRKP